MFILLYLKHLEVYRRYAVLTSGRCIDNTATLYRRNDVVSMLLRSCINRGSYMSGHLI